MARKRILSPGVLMAAALLAGCSALTVPAFAAGSTPAFIDQQDGNSAAQNKLNKSQFKDVKVSVDNNGIATLSGTVSLYEYKKDAANRVRKAKGVNAVRNEIEVTGKGEPVSDEELKKKLGEKLTYDRVGYGNAFNSITMSVENGVVTLGGHARTDVDKDSAVALVSTYPGVKDVVDDIEVDPTSIMDDQTRLAIARAVYGYPSLNKYAIDPAKPIRISVQNGHVELYGVVDSKADKDAAYLRANSVPGVFSVKNYLQVAGQQSESDSK
ncbi:BON domain-containing protein [Occallatibacter savannae]|uniref:BON domain-containing protein n=1 Tax=Occallatibacter savannae TaxID=1002691 RepID=UPI001EF4AE7F|nr:BON domain-containing protein [Occallatibacter savannae]